MAYAATLRGFRAAPPATTSTTSIAADTGLGLFRAIAGAIVDSRRRQAIREMRRHQAFGPLISIKHIGLTRHELLPF
jgi:hypothetical protein